MPLLPSRIPQFLRGATGHQTWSRRRIRRSADASLLVVEVLMHLSNTSEFFDGKIYISDVNPKSKTSSSPRRGFDETPPIPKTGVLFIFQH